MHNESDKIIKSIDRGFFRTREEADKTLKCIRRILDDFSQSQDLNRTAKDVIKLLEQIWDQFSIGKYAKIFVDFAAAEKALYGFGQYYRDHLIHIFNVYVMGLLTFSAMLKTEDEKKIFNMLGIQREPNRVPFASKYNERRRLYYVWCLTSTFHDIAIPLDHREELLQSLDRFMGYFKIETEKLSLKFPFLIQADISRYSDIMERLFASGVSLSNDLIAPTYSITREPTGASLYFRSAFTQAVDKYDHGVFGAYFLLKSIEEMFLTGRNPNLKYDLDVSAVTCENRIINLPRNKSRWLFSLKKAKLNLEQSNSLARIYDLERGETKLYNDYVIEQDVARAALAIALHNLNVYEAPKIFPIRFSKFPITFCLILFDELQEFRRPESAGLSEIVRFKEFPVINVCTALSTHGIECIQISAELDLRTPPPKIVRIAIDRYNKWASGKKLASVKSFEELVQANWKRIFSILEGKISFAEGESLAVYVKITVEMKDPCGKPLLFKSRNWKDSFHQRRSH